MAKADSLDVFPSVDGFTLGQLREYTRDWPDNTPIVPHFFAYTPDHYPSVTIEGFGSVYDDADRRLLAIGVSQTPLGGDDVEDEDDEDDEDEHGVIE
jgi:hypothetical protein